ncbi:MAG: nucleotidyltransferase family protein [Candidatus Binataceae bacterium]
MLVLDGILLAAGESHRMGYPKPLLKIGDQFFIERAVETMLSAADRLIVVLGAHADGIRPRVPADRRILLVENPNYHHGQLSSLKAGLAHVRSNAAAVMVHLADHPLVKADTFAILKRQYERMGKPVAIARYQGRRGHPVIFGRPLFSELMSAPEEGGARAVVNADSSRVVYADVDDLGVVLDLDTPGDLARAGLPQPPLN